MLLITDRIPQGEQGRGAVPGLLKRLPKRQKDPYHHQAWYCDLRNSAKAKRGKVRGETVCAKKRYGFALRSPTVYTVSIPLSIHCLYKKPL